MIKISLNKDDFVSVLHKDVSLRVCTLGTVPFAMLLEVVPKVFDTRLFFGRVFILPKAVSHDLEHCHSRMRIPDEHSVQKTCELGRCALECHFLGRAILAMGQQPEVKVILKVLLELLLRIIVVGIGIDMHDQFILPGREHVHAQGKHVARRMYILVLENFGRSLVDTLDLIVMLLIGAH